MICAALAACSGSSGRTGSDLALTHDLASPLLHDLALASLTDLSTNPDLMMTPYPAGPYGNTVGATIPPLVWEGYADPLADAIATSKPYGTYTMNDLRTSGRPYAAVHVAEFT
jgi:hypothetical protein